MDENEQNIDLDNDADDQQDDLEVEGKVESKATEKPKRTPEEQLAYLEGRTQRLRKKLGLTETRKAKEEAKPGELDTAGLAYLAAKGIEDDEDIAFIQKRMDKWDMTLREVLKDEDVQAKLKGMKIEREVKGAMPSSQKRSGAGESNLDYWIAKYEQTGELPKDFDLRSQVIDAKIAKENPNKPSWR
jgi:hypothetical protein